MRHFVVEEHQDETETDVPDIVACTDSAAEAESTVDECLVEAEGAMQAAFAMQETVELAEKNPEAATAAMEAYAALHERLMNRQPGFTTESFQTDRKACVESFKKAAGLIWEKIVQFLKRIGEHFSFMWQEMTSFRGAVKLKLKIAKKRVAKIDSSKPALPIPTTSADMLKFFNFLPKFKDLTGRKLGDLMEQIQASWKTNIVKLRDWSGDYWTRASETLIDRCRTAKEEDGQDFFEKAVSGLPGNLKHLSASSDQTIELPFGRKIVIWKENHGAEKTPSTFEEAAKWLGDVKIKAERGSTFVDRLLADDVVLAAMPVSTLIPAITDIEDMIELEEKHAKNVFDFKSILGKAEHEAKLMKYDDNQPSGRAKFIAAYLNTVVRLYGTVEKTRASLFNGMARYISSWVVRSVYAYRT